MKEIFYIQQERLEQARKLWNQKEDKPPVRRRTCKAVRKMINAKDIAIPKALSDLKLPEEQEHQLPKRTWTKEQVKRMIND